MKTNRIIFGMPKRNKEEIQYEVEKILKKRTIDGAVEYLVLWKGYREHEATWEPAEYLQHASKKLKEFENTRKKEKINKLKRKKRQTMMKEQNQLYKQQKLNSYQELKDIVQKNVTHNPPVFDVPNKTKDNQPIMSFQQFLTRPPTELVKVSRFNQIQGKWVEKLETCAEIIGKNAARQLYRTNAHQDVIEIKGFSILQGVQMVRFEKQGKHYQCQLDDLIHLCPCQLIDYLLNRYDPVLRRLKIQDKICQNQLEDSQMSD